jgi:hypothetical protein
MDQCDLTAAFWRLVGDQVVQLAQRHALHAQKVPQVGAVPLADCRDGGCIVLTHLGWDWALEDNF